MTTPSPVTGSASSPCRPKSVVVTATAPSRNPQRRGVAGMRAPSIPTLTPRPSAGDQSTSTPRVRMFAPDDPVRIPATTVITRIVTSSSRFHASGSGGDRTASGGRNTGAETGLPTSCTAADGATTICGATGFGTGTAGFGGSRRSGIAGCAEAGAGSNSTQVRTALPAAALPTAALPSPEPPEPVPIRAGVPDPLPVASPDPIALLPTAALPLHATATLPGSSPSASAEFAGTGTSTGSRVGVVPVDTGSAGSSASSTPPPAFPLAESGAALPDIRSPSAPSARAVAPDASTTSADTATTASSRPPPRDPIEPIATASRPARRATVRSAGSGSPRVRRPPARRGCPRRTGGRDCGSATARTRRRPRAVRSARCCAR